MTQTQNPLAQLANADRTLSTAIHAAADQLDRIATGNLDTAFARLDASAAAVRERLAAAFARLNATVAGVVESVEETAVAITAALAVNRWEEPAAVVSVRVIVDPTSAQVNGVTDPNDPGNDIIDLSPPAAVEPGTVATVERQDSQQPRQDAQTVEPAREPSSVENAPPANAQHVEKGVHQTDALAEHVATAANHPADSRRQNLAASAHNPVTRPASPANIDPIDIGPASTSTAKRKPRRKS